MNEPSTLAAPPDLSQCEREPIHIPAAIQPHGALLAVLPDGSRITHASANLGDYLPCGAGDVLGKPLATALGEAASRALAGPGFAASPSETAQRIVGLAGRTLQLQGFRSGARLCIDIQPVDSDAREGTSIGALQAVLESFKTSRSPLELCELAVRGLRALTGYDRVMAYRFGEDGHGEVIAEARAAQLEPYLGQRYPASDIPAQARRLYVRQRVGVVADSNYQPVSLFVDAALDDGTPLDLTYSALRSVSPIHREFMRNMKTAASMTIGLTETRGTEEGTLWGMLVCHHETPRAPSLELRSYAAVVGQVATLLLESQGTAEVFRDRKSREATLHRLLEGLGSSRPLGETLASLETELLQLLGACGALVRTRGTALRLGRTPAPQAGDMLLEALREDAAAEPVAIDDLGIRFPALAAQLEGCAGALLLPLGGGGGGDAVLWFRPEQLQTITWGGNPAKAVASDPGTGRISPRASFAAWREVRRGRSVAWSAADRALAAELRHGIEAELARRTRLALELYDGIFESSPTALLLVGERGDIRMLNREVEQLFGYERRELEGRALATLVPHRLRPEVDGRRIAELAAVRQTAERRELAGLRRDGSEFPFEFSLNPVTSSQFAGEPMVQVSIIDLTARHESERHRRLAQERLQSIALHVPAMIGYWNQELRCEFANEGHRAAYGLAPEAVVGMTLRELLGDALYARIEPQVLEVLAGEERRFERVATRADGSESYVDERYVPDVADDGTVRGFYVLAMDVTQLRRATRELEAANTALTHTNHELEQFVYTASHDLRSPLRAIASLAQFIIEDDRTLGAETAGRMQTIRSRAERMQKMLDDVLTYAHAGKDDHQSGVPTTLEKLVAELLTTLDLPSGFTLDCDPSLRAVPVRPVPLSQVLGNLIGNAVKHHDLPHGRIGLAVEDCGGHLRVSVTDDGPGIPPRYAESVFEMFSTLKPRDTVEGTGMGLALVRKIVRRFGGQCGIVPSAGRGTSIWFDWPKMTGEATGPGAAEGNEHAGEA